jgi:hypothetical protein
MNISAKTTIKIEIGGRKLILSSEEAHELYSILRKELGLENRFKEVWLKTQNNNTGYFQTPQPWDDAKITCGAIN